MRPKAINERLAALEEICEEFPLRVPLKVAAEYQGVQAATLAQSIEAGNYPAGYTTRGIGKARGDYVIPTLKFWAWHSGDKMHEQN